MSLPTPPSEGSFLQTAIYPLKNDQATVRLRFGNRMAIILTSKERIRAWGCCIRSGATRRLPSQAPSRQLQNATFLSLEPSFLRSMETPLWLTEKCVPFFFLLVAGCFSYRVSRSLNEPNKVMAWYVSLHLSPLRIADPYAPGRNTPTKSQSMVGYSLCRSPSIEHLISVPQC
jgi:hypothetical protein